MHLKGNWLDESFPSFIDFLLSKIKISPTDKAPFCAKPLKLHSKSFAKHTKFKLLHNLFCRRRPSSPEQRLSFSTERSNRNAPTASSTRKPLKRCMRISSLSEMPPSTPASSSNVLIKRTQVWSSEIRYLGEIQSKM